MKPTIVLILCLGVACSSDGDTPAVDAGIEEIACTVTVTATPDVGARTISGVGGVQCDAPASIRVETCVQWNPSGTFEDIQCVSNSDSEVFQLEVTNLSSCGLSPGRSFRTRILVQVNADQVERVSAEVACE